MPTTATKPPTATELAQQLLDRRAALDTLRPALSDWLAGEVGRQVLNHAVNYAARRYTDVGYALFVEQSGLLMSRYKEDILAMPCSECLTTR